MTYLPFNVFPSHSHWPVWRSQRPRQRRSLRRFVFTPFLDQIIDSALQSQLQASARRRIPTDFCYPLQRRRTTRKKTRSAATGPMSISNGCGSTDSDENKMNFDVKTIDPPLPVPSYPPAPFPAPSLEPEAERPTDATAEEPASYAGKPTLLCWTVGPYSY